VKNIKDISEERLKSLFAEFGEIESVHIPQSDNAADKKDYGYVCFKKSEDAEKAVEAMNKKVLEDGELLIVNRHVSKRENELFSQDSSKIGPISQNLKKTWNSNIFVKYIPADVTEEEI
jgi:RNA recognition motif-containing protein